jgi:hypothetical protein
MNQWLHFTAERRAQKLASGKYTFIPSNGHGIPEGYFLDADLIKLLRERKGQPSVVKFVLDVPAPSKAH